MGGRQRHGEAGEMAGLGRGGPWEEGEGAAGVATRVPRGRNEAAETRRGAAGRAGWRNWEGYVP